MSETSGMMGLTSGWLDAQAGGAYSNIQSVTCWQQCAPYFYYPSLAAYSNYPARTIKLTMSEVERLRKCARVDKELKKILEKFTEQIEVTVDFS